MTASTVLQRQLCLASISAFGAMARSSYGTNSLIPAPTVGLHPHNRKEFST